MPKLSYLNAYPERLREDVAALIRAGRLGEVLLSRYPEAHQVRTDRSLYDYVSALRLRYMRNTAPLSRICFDPRLQTLKHALGIHATVSRVQGNKLRAKREIHVDGVFREAPEAFLRMIVVHELAHLKEREHDRAFYQLCCHMEPDYHQLEFDVRAWLCHLDNGGANPWQRAADAAKDGAGGGLSAG